MTTSQLNRPSFTTIGSNSSMSSARSGLFASARNAFDSSFRNLLDNLGGEIQKNDDLESSPTTTISRPVMLSTLPEVHTHLERSTALDNSLADISSNSEEDTSSRPQDMSAVMEEEKSSDGAESQYSEGGANTDTTRAIAETIVSPVDTGADDEPGVFRGETSGKTSPTENHAQEKVITALPEKDPAKEPPAELTKNDISGRERDSHY